MNAGKLKFTGSKYKKKIYYWHTGHVGGLKTTTPSTLDEKGKFHEVLARTSREHESHNAPQKPKPQPSTPTLTLTLTQRPSMHAETQKSTLTLTLTPTQTTTPLNMQ